MFIFYEIQEDENNFDSALDPSLMCKKVHLNFY